MPSRPRLPTSDVADLPLEIRATFATLSSQVVDLSALSDDEIEALGNANAVAVSARIATLSRGGRREAKRLWLVRMFVGTCRAGGWPTRIEPASVLKFARDLARRGVGHAAIADYLGFLHETARLQGCHADWLSNLIARERNLAIGEPKRKDRLPPITSRDIWAFAWRQFEGGTQALQTAHGRKAQVAAAVRQRDGALAILATPCPLRRANHAGLDLERNLDLETGRLQIDAELMKGRRRFDCRLPSLITDVLRLHVETGREILRRGRDVTALFLQHRGRPLSPQGLYAAVTRRSAEDPAIPQFSPHWFRHALPNLVAAEAPELRWIVTELLTHADASTDREYGNLFDTSAAAGKAHGLGEVLRAAAAKTDIDASDGIVP